jgi:YgiT-type zinc finger domain-containing protein
VCANCGGEGLQCREVTRYFGRGRSLLVIEGIPMLSCPHCGESYFTAQTMHEIERIKALRGSLAVTKPNPIAVFPGEGA